MATQVIVTPVQEKVKKGGKRRNDMVKRSATARFEKFKQYKTKRPGGKEVTYVDSHGVEKTRPRRYRAETQLKRRHKYYTTNKRGQQGSSLVQARINTFTRQQVKRLVADIAEAGTHWSDEKDDNGKFKVHFQCSDAFNNLIGIKMAALHDAIYKDAAERARKTEDQYRSNAPVQVHKWHVEAAWKQRLHIASAGRRAMPGVTDVDVSIPETGRTDEDGNPVLSRARYLSTDEQRKAIKGVCNIARCKPEVTEYIDTLVKEQATEAIRLAMLRRFRQPNNVQLMYSDAEYAFNALGTFPANISGL